MSLPRTVRITLPVVNMLFVSMLFAHSFASAQPSQTRSTVQYNLLLLPSSQAANRTLEKNASFTWAGNRTIREGLASLGENFGISIWLDRRVDPSQLVNYKTTPNQTTLRVALSEVAALANAKMALIENVVYIGPEEFVSRAQRSAVELHDSISRQSADKSATGRQLRWAELATPGEVLADIARNWSIRIDGELPHDLLHSGELKTPCTLATQLTILLTGFEMEAKWVNNKHFRLTGMETRDSWRSTYAKNAFNRARISASAIRKLKQNFAGAAFRPSRDTVDVRGSTDFHLALLLPAKQRQQPAANILRQRWGFEVKNHSAKSIMEFLAAQIGFNLTWDPACSAVDLEAVVELKVDQATLDEILTSFNRASNLTARRKQLTVTVSPAPN